MHRTLSLLTVSLALAACGQSGPPRLAKHGPAPAAPAGEVSESLKRDGLAKLRAVRQAGEAKGLIRWQEKDVRVTAADATVVLTASGTDVDGGRVRLRARVTAR